MDHSLPNGNRARRHLSARELWRRAGGVGRRTPVAAKAASLDAARSHPLTRRTVSKRALRATGSHPRPSLVLLPYAAANIVALVPITPGWLGLVEVSPGGLLILAGVHGSDALLATLAYRLASYWLPWSAGPPAYLLFRHRYRGAGPAPPAHTHSPATAAMAATLAAAASVSIEP